MITNAILELPFIIFAGIISILPDGIPLPTVFHSMASWFGDHIYMLDFILPVNDIFVVIVWIIVVEVAFSVYRFVLLITGRYKM